MLKLKSQKYTKVKNSKKSLYSKNVSKACRNQTPLPHLMSRCHRDDKISDIVRRGCRQRMVGGLRPPPARFQRSPSVVCTCTHLHTAVHDRHISSSHVRGLWGLRFTQSDYEPPRDEDVRSGDVSARGVLRASYLRPMICLSMVIL